ncbi:MAG: 1-acyl-sn-glycerol-3-phosphate acyltransferase [Syntrophales bacterium]|nr:1-acyl-sn-glycerol-3-phosphate acyltransferase [Syntrophales bacterium]MCK9527731.1 1-acyl-sn-glycerol-3-phosphate acyltransferase [Syntrophales bacterium]MDX9921614.1 1-acyl-sn-glycerol-3-phosphate acyltransferase [Syntrophales bacterium]
MLEKLTHRIERGDYPSRKLLSRLYRWISRAGEHYEGELSAPTRYPFFWILDRMLSRVTIAQEDVETLKDLSTRGIVVYSLKNRSQLNCLIIRSLLAGNDIDPPAYCHGTGMLLWQPYRKAIRTLVSRIINNPYRNKYLKRITTEGKSSLIYVRGSAHVSSPYPKDPLLQLIEAQPEMTAPVFLVPQLVVYGRRREREVRSFMEILFGPSDNPGPVRRSVLFFRFSRKAAVISCKPIDLQQFMAENRNASPGILSNLLRQEITSRINAERRSILGPLLKSRDEIVGQVLRDVEMVRVMQEIAEEEGSELQDVVRKASRYLHEIAADYRDSYIAVLDRILTWVWNNIYDGVVIDREGLAKIREISKKMPFVIVPCHRSHIDYLLIHYIFYYNNIQLPFIAAGNNLLVWPIGHIFRRSGAFFLRRTFAGNRLYAQVFEKYIKVLLQEGHPLEFFIEGGRSRTGKMVMPKYGLLSMVIQAYREKACDDIAIIPVYIGYDKVIEEKSYLQELGGGVKKKESTAGIVKSSRVLKKRYGRVYLNIGEPIQIKEYLDRADPSIEERTTEERQSLYRKMGYEIAHRINDVSVVTPFALVAAALLGHYRRGIAHDDLRSIIDELHDYLEHRKVCFSSTFAGIDYAITEALNFFESSGNISKMGIDEDDEPDEEFAEIIYSVESGRRMGLEYYKNTILHFFLPISFVAASILSSDEDTILLSRVMEDYRFLKRLFWNEFIFDDESDDLEEIRETLLYLADRGMVARDHFFDETSRLIITGRGRISLAPFAGLIQNYIESYWIVLRGSSYLKNKERSDRDLLRKTHKLGMKMYKKGEIAREEALSPPNYQGALRFLNDAGVVTVSSGSVEGGRKREKKRETKTVVLNEDRSRLETIRQKLFKFVSPR